MHFEEQFFFTRWIFSFPRRRVAFGDTAGSSGELAGAFTQNTNYFKTGPRSQIFPGEPDRKESSYQPPPDVMMYSNARGFTRWET